MNDIELKTIAIDGKARLNEVTVNGKQFQTPLFMPVATRGALKSLPFNYLEHTDIILANTYHLFLRPGLDVIQEFDGLHKYQIDLMMMVLNLKIYMMDQNFLWIRNYLWIYNKH